MESEGLEMNVPFQSGGPVYSGMCSETESRMQMTIESLGNELAHLRQENAELKRDAAANMASLNESGKFLMEIAKDLQCHKAALEKCKISISIILSCFEENHDESGLHQPTEPLQSVDYELAKEAISQLEPLSPQPTQDPATDIAYGLYPSSARPVNPKTTDRTTENWVGYTPIDPQNK